MDHLRCSVPDCGQRAYAVSERSGKLLCFDCWSFAEDPGVTMGGGFGRWLRRIFRIR